MAIYTHSSISSSYHLFWSVSWQKQRRVKRAHNDKHLGKLFVLQSEREPAQTLQTLAISSEIISRNLFQGKNCKKHRYEDAHKSYL